MTVRPEHTNLSLHADAVPSVQHKSTQQAWSVGEYSEQQMYQCASFHSILLYDR
jgi:hypothetical protein